MKIKSSKFVVQKYIENPLLFEQKKFDIRFFLLITTSCQVYICQDMYIRLSAYNYNINDNSKFGHLTNIALPKYSANYDEEKAIINTLTLEEYVREHINKDFNFNQDMLPRIHQIVGILAGIILRKFKSFNSYKKSFEIFGLDFMIDHELNVWFIEANTNPAITLGNTFIEKLIPRMLDDAFKLTLDKQFPLPGKNLHENSFLTKEEIKKIKKNYNETVFPCDGFDDNESIWKKMTDKEIEKCFESEPNK